MQYWINTATIILSIHRESNTSIYDEFVLISLQSIIIIFITLTIGQPRNVLEDFEYNLMITLFQMSSSYVEKQALDERSNHNRNKQQTFWMIVDVRYFFLQSWDLLFMCGSTSAARLPLLTCAPWPWWNSTYTHRVDQFGSSIEESNWQPEGWWKWSWVEIIFVCLLNCWPKKLLIRDN